MKKILLNRLTEIKETILFSTVKRSGLHPKSNEAGQLSIKIFEMEARLSEVKYLIDIYNGH